VLSTIADDDTQRADATRLALERMSALYAVLTPDQRKQFDRRIIQSLREPLGNS
jgi:Spy/CpxP family protein refolding chaperone